MLLIITIKPFFISTKYKPPALELWQGEVNAKLNRGMKKEWVSAHSFLTIRIISYQEKYITKKLTMQEDGYVYIISALLVT